MGMGESNQLEEPEQPHTTGEWGCSAFSHPVSTLHPHLRPHCCLHPHPAGGWASVGVPPVQEQWEAKGLLQLKCCGALNGFPAVTSKTPFPMGCLVQNELQM